MKSNRFSPLSDSAEPDPLLRSKMLAGKIYAWALSFEKGRGVLHFSSDLLRFLGLGPENGSVAWEDFIGNMVHPDYRKPLNNMATSASVVPGYPIHIEFRIWSRTDNDWRWILAFGSTDAVDPEGQWARVSGATQDIQELVDARLEREREHALNTTLIDSLPGAFLVADEGQRIVHCNAHFSSFFFDPDDSPLGAVWTDIFLPEDRPQALAASRESGETTSFTAHARLRDGVRGSFFCRCRHFSQNGDKRLLVLLFDVTETEEVRNQVERQRSRLDTVVEAANLGTWDWNLVTGEVHYNKTWAVLAGLRLEDIQGSVEAWENALFPEDLEGAMQAVDAHVRGETDMYEAEFRMQRPDGGIIWAVDRGRVVERDESGQIIRLMGVLQDITAQKKATDELASSKNLLELVMRETHFGAWDWNPVSGEIAFSESFFSILGFEEGEVNPTFEAWSELIHPDDIGRSEAALAKLISGENTRYECEMRMRHKDGNYVWTLDMGHAVAWDDEGRLTRVVGGHFDIQNRKEQVEKQEEALTTIALQKMILEQAVEERTVLLREAKERIDAILATTGQLPGELQSPFDGSVDLAGAGSVLDMAMTTGDGEADHEEDNFADSLGKAFDLITEKMWWYKAIIDSIPFPIFVTDMEKRWTYLNAPALENVGAAELKDILGVAGEPWGVDQELRADEADADGENQFISRYHPGLKRFFQGQASYLYDQSGRRIGHIEAVQDVTKLHEADERTRIMLDSMPLSCIFWSADFKTVDCNQAAPKLFRMGSKQEYLDHFFDLLPEYQPDGMPSRAKALEVVAKTFAEGYLRFEWVYRLPDGSLMPAEITAVRVRHGDEDIVLAYTRDLTELKRKEAELDRERRLLVKIMDSSPVCFVILVGGVIRFSTPYAKEFFGVDIGSSLADFFIDDEGRAEFMDEVMRYGTLNWRIVSVRAGDGSRREMLANAFLAEYFDEPCVMSWFLDVTEMRETERQLRLARDAAEESTRAKGEFLANMSHEIRTPMNAILGMTRLVLDTPLTELQRDRLEKAEHSARALLRILNDILDFSKIEAGKLEMEIVDFNLDSVLRTVMDIFRETAKENALELSLDVERDTPTHLTGDPLRLHQILINLVGNAIKFTSKGGVYVTVSVLERDPARVKLGFSVRDTGIGLTPEQQDKLFSAFSQADGSTTRRYGGTGLGLAISKRLVALMHGEISCVSGKGSGSEFSFTAVFGLSTAEDAASDAYGATPGLSAHERIAHLKGRRILVAEDNEINQIVARELLEKAGFIVELASNGREAVAMALNNQYDLIFMDIQMPEMDGLTAARELRNHARLAGLPIVAMTAHAMVGDREKSLAVGMNAHVTKPIDSDEVFAVLAKWLT